MAAIATRKIVKIDEDRCNGCGLCVPKCAEGAIQIIDGKARLMADNLCDGLGNCLGTCPEDAITIEERPADAFDEEAVARHLQQEAPGASHPAAGCPGAALRTLSEGAASAPPGGCPGTMARKLDAPDAPGPAAVTDRPSRLRHWPVQLALLPVRGEIWQDADVLIAADCVPAVMPDFHDQLLAGKTLAVGCPKLDDIQPYVEKLTRVFAANNIRSVTVAHMEVPCCSGIVHAVQTALEQAGRNDVGTRDVTVGIDGTIQHETTLGPPRGSAKDS